jgi:diguanylate cyclase (GGDEF)-like protein
MRLHLKLLLCFLLVSVALHLIAYISILNPRIRHAAQFVEESHQEILSEYRLSAQLQTIDRCLQEIEIEALRLRENRPPREETASGQLGRATGELYLTLAAFKEQYSTFKRLQSIQWQSLSELERLTAPDESETQERILIAKVAESLPVLERNITSYMALVAKSPDAATELLEGTLGAQIRQELLPSVGIAAATTERRMDEETQKIEAILDRAYKQTAAAVVTSLLVSLVLAIMISQSVARPIRKLREAALAIGEGDLDATVNVESKDELGDLAKAFNRMGSDLRGYVAERFQAQQVLEQTNRKLSSSLEELHARSSESALTGEMANMLQSCVDLDEAGQVIVRALQRSIPHTSGALFLFSASRNLVEEIAAWGDSPPKENVFPPNDCWALRRGNPYGVLDAQIGMPCVHLGQEASVPYVCIPLSAQGDTLGVLHLRTHHEHAHLLEKSSDGTSSRVQQLAVTLAEQAALALANLKLRDTLKHQSIRDPLTGLFNRRYMEESLERELGRSARKNRSLSIFMLDLDHFKKFNDTFGHEAGDVMLREFAYSMQKRMRGEDIVCRYGGEEFVVILVEAALEVSEKRAEQLLDDVRHLNVLWRGQSIGGITLSIGIAAFPHNGSSVDALLRAADRALYRAKEGGRDRLVVADATEREPSSIVTLEEKASS